MAGNGNKLEFINDITVETFATFGNTQHDRLIHAGSSIIPYKNFWLEEDVPGGDLTIEPPFTVAEDHLFIRFPVGVTFKLNGQNFTTASRDVVYCLLEKFNEV